MKRQTKKAFSNLSVRALAKYKEPAGKRLSSQAIGSEITRRVKAHQTEHPAIVRLANKRRTRTLQ